MRKIVFTRALPVIAGVSSLLLSCGGEDATAGAASAVPSGTPGMTAAPEMPALATPGIPAPATSGTQTPPTLGTSQPPGMPSVPETPGEPAPPNENPAVPPCQGDDCEWTPVECTSPFFDPEDFTDGLPELRIKPDAGLVFYLDFDGGRYKDEDPDLDPYYTGSSEERQNIVQSFNYMIQYFAMFDVAITTKQSDVGSASDAEAWGWIIISPDVSGGRAGVGVIDDRDDHARARAGTSTIEDSDRSRRIAHELGHNLGLDHNGVDGEKFEDWNGWDGEFGSILGGGGEGERNGWVTADTEDSGEQDSMEVIRAQVEEFDSKTPNQGWAIDDFPETSALCAGDTPYRVGVIGHPGDVDTFAFSWAGGDLEVEAVATEVSAALVSLTITRDGEIVGTDRVADAPAGVYQVSVESAGTFDIMESQSVGTFDALGYYELYVR